MALDVGEKRVGVAVGDSEVKIAVPNGALQNDDSVVDEIGKIIKLKDIDTIVVGLPRNSSGEETKQSEFAREFAEKLTVFNLPIVFQDESLTSVEAEDILQSLQGNNQRNLSEKGEIDAKAAAIILTDYLEANFGRKN